MAESGGFHEKTLAGIEYAAALALDLSLKATPGRWEAEPCDCANAFDGQHVVRFCETGGDSSELAANDAHFIAAARHGLPSFATAVVALVAEIRRLKEKCGETDTPDAATSAALSSAASITSRSGAAGGGR